MGFADFADVFGVSASAVDGAENLRMLQILFTGFKNTGNYFGNHL